MEIKDVKKLYIITLLIVVGLLLTVDIVTRYWFWAGINLKFDPANFNNIVSPITGLISFVVYFLTLLYVIKQNNEIQFQSRIIQSQNLRPYYEKSIDNIIQKVKDTKYVLKIPNEPDTPYDGFNFINVIQDAVDLLHKDKHYLEDIKLEKMETDYVLLRTYSKYVIFFSEFTIGLGNKFQYATIKSLIEEIEQSKLIPDEQAQLKKRIRNELLGQYLSFVSFASHSFYPPVPVLVLSDLSSPVREKTYYTMKSISKTNFGEWQDWFNDHLKE